MTQAQPSDRDLDGLDRVLADRLVDRGLVDSGTVRSVWARRRAEDAPSPLARALVREGVVPAESIRPIEEEVLAHTRLCGACGTAAFVDPSGPGLTRCPDCGGPIRSGDTPASGSGSGAGTVDPGDESWADLLRSRGGHEGEHRFGDYRILAELGRGGMGAVYRARHVRLEREVALKLIRTGRDASEKQIKRFLREARASARLSHPNVVQVHELGEQDGLTYFTMDLVEGRPLDRGLVGTPRPVEESVDLLVGMARGVGHAHEHGVIHRDLKPQNVIVEPDGRPRVTDFGLARDLDARTLLTRSGAILGTPYYMSPEQARGDARHVGPEADVWSLGVILYQLLTHRLPFQAESSTRVLSMICDEDPVPPSELNEEVPEPLENIVHKALEKEPERRYPDGNALADDLERLRRGSQVEARRIGPLARLRRGLRRHALTVSVVAFAALVALGGLGAWWIIGGSGARAAAERREVRTAFSDAVEEASSKLVRASTELRNGYPRASRRAATAGLERLDEAEGRLADLVHPSNGPPLRRTFREEGGPDLRADLLVARADALRAIGGPDGREEAEDDLRAAVEAAPAHAGALLGLADLLVGSGRPAEGLDVLAPLPSGEPRAERLRGEALLALGRPGEVVSRLDPLPEAGSDLRDRLLLLRGRAHLRDGRPEDALEDAWEAAEGEEEMAAAILEARAVERLDRPHDAWRTLSAAVRRWPDRAAPYRARATVEVGLGRLRAAAADLGRAIEKAEAPSARVDDRLRRARLLHLLGEPERAGEVLRPLREGAGSADRARALVGEALGEHLAGRTEEALSLLGRASDLDGSLAAPHALRGRILLGRDRRTPARAAFRLALERSPHHAAAAAGLARALLGDRPDEGRAREALELAERAVALSPARPGPLLARADAREARGDLSGAADDRRRAFRHHGRDPGAALADLGYELILLDDEVDGSGLDGRAEPLLERSVRFSLYAPEALAGLGHLARHRHRHDEVLSRTGEAVAENPLSRPALSERARALVSAAQRAEERGDDGTRDERFREAERVLTRLLGEGVDDWDVRHSRGYVRWALGDHAGAVDDFLVAIEHDPHSELAHRNLIVNLRALDRDERADEVERTLGELEGRVDRAREAYRRGRRLDREGRHAEAVRHLARADALAPTEARHPYHLATAQIRAGRTVESQMTMARAVVLEPRYESTFVENIWQLRDLGDREAMLRAWRERAEEAPDDPGPRLLLGLIPVLSAIRGETRREKAVDGLRELDRLLESHPGSVVVRAYRALGHLALGLDDEAERDLEIIETFAPDARVVRFYRALLAGRSGDRARLLDLLEEVDDDGLNLTVRVEVELLPDRLRRSEAVRRLVGR